MILRDLAGELANAAAEYPAVTLLGPRQSGKTTLARACFPGKPHVSLEDPDVRAAASLDPRGFLNRFGDGAILDEVQRLPELLSYLQGILDRDNGRGRFILTGSHQPRLRESVAQSLAGRTALLELWPFSLRELRRYGRPLEAFDLVVRGFYPRLHQERLDPRRFYNGYLRTYVERDVRALAQLRDLDRFQAFLTLLAGRVGQVANLSAMSNDVGVSAPALRNWLGILKASFVVFELPPWFANVRKRVVKSPKVYFADVGLAAFLLGIRTPDQARRDPARGGLYENLVIAEVMKGALNRGVRPDLHYYRDSNGVECDLVIRDGRRLAPVEIKSAETFTPDFLKGFASFAAAVGKDAAPGVVLYNGSREFAAGEVSVFNPFGVEDLWAQLVGESRPAS